MNLSFTKEDEAFRSEVREFLAEKYPQDLRDKVDQGRMTKEDQVRWQRILNDRGWFAINWPVEYGGTGWTPTQKYIFANEMAEANAPGIIPFGVSMVSPVIYTYGSEEQKKRFLPDILESNVWWCQGYSEPGAGSDLASLQTKATLSDDGSHYIVNGSKTWTTLAQNADWIFCLVRTSSEGVRQQGISFLLIDMKTPGVEVQPIIMVDGGHEVNSVYFTDVKVPVENRIGEENKGWTYAKVLLQHERTGIAGVANSKRELRRLKDVAGDIGDPQTSCGTLAGNSSFNEKVSKLELELLALEHTELRVLSAIASGGAPGVESSLLKVKGTEVQQGLTELFVEAAGYHTMPYVGQEWGSNTPPVGADFAGRSAPRYFNQRKASIYGGSNEIQKNIVAKAILGL